jgi:hypothetical protein
VQTEKPDFTMKKLLLSSFAAAVALISVSCGPDWWDNYTTKLWSVKNTTEQLLILKCPYSESESRSNPVLPRDIEYREFEIAPKSRINIFKSAVPLADKPWFSFYFNKSVEAFGTEAKWQILSVDGTVLKEWKYSDKELSDQRFFKDTEWSSTESGLWQSFVFIISNEDIN